MRNTIYDNITINIENSTLDMIECIPALTSIIDKTLKIMDVNNSDNCRLWQFHHHKNNSYFSMRITRSYADVHPKIQISIEDPEVARDALSENYFEIFALDGVRNIFDKEKIKKIYTGTLLPGEYLDESGQWVNPLTCY